MIGMSVRRIGIFVSVVDGFGKGVTFTCTDENAALKLQTTLLATRSFSVSTQQPAD